MQLQAASADLPLPGFALRPEAPADAAFRLALFRTSRGPGWDQLRLPPDLLARIMEQQFHAQTQGYRAAYPAARLEIVTVGDDKPVGRLATDLGADALHLVDIALVPDWRGRGLGGAILRRLIGEAEARGLPLTLQVACDNLRAQRLYRRLGLEPTTADATHLTMRWRPAPPEPA
ncbi:GNAT family N-acetyltransferase [Caulobacter sp. LARHSG274]